MALDDLGDDEKESVKDSKTEELKNELGVESKEDLEAMDDRVQTIAELVISIDSELESIKDDMELVKRAVINDDEDDSDDEGGEELWKVD